MHGRERRHNSELAQEFAPHFMIMKSQIPAFANDVAALATEHCSRQWQGRFGRFWTTSPGIPQHFAIS
jgi:hypothetical protein